MRVTRSRSTRRTTTYDVLVVGGGIHGLAIAYEAASRGLRVALVEAGDFGSGASFNHQKTAHGGLRSLQSGRLDRARESIRERRALARIAPWLLRPLPFLVGTYRSVVEEPAGAARRVQARRWLGRHRNDGRRAGAAPAGAAAGVEGRDAAAVPRRPPGGPDRRRAVVRLPDGRGRPADVRVRRGGRPRRAPISPTTSKRSSPAEGGRADRRHAASAIG